MARRLSRPAPAKAEAPKRRASTRLSASHEVKRVKSNATLSGEKTTSKKSKYFEADGSEESSEPSSESEGGDSGSDYEGNESEASPEPDSEPEGLEDSEEESGKGGGGQRKGGSDASTVEGKELWREGVRTGLGPGKEVFVAKPKARDAGGVEYQDESLHPNTKLFLLDIAKNNDRQWMKGRFLFLAPSAAKTDRVILFKRTTPTSARQRRTLRPLSKP